MISTRGRYALRVMIDLAEHGGEEYIPMKDVAARQDISLKYLEKILPLLTQGNLVTGIHGRGGGYRFPVDAAIHLQHACPMLEVVFVPSASPFQPVHPRVL